jgi:hypothetical protein
MVNRLLAVNLIPCDTSCEHLELTQLTIPAQSSIEISVQSNDEIQSLEKAGTDLIAHEYCDVISKPDPVTVISVLFVKYAARGRNEIQLSFVSKNLSTTLPPLEVSDT